MGDGINFKPGRALAGGAVEFRLTGVGSGWSWGWYNFHERAGLRLERVVDKLLFEQQLLAIAEAKYAEACATPYGIETGRRIELASARADAIRPAIIAQLMGMGRRLGAHFLAQTPAVALEQFAINAIINDHDAAALIKSLINSYMLAYITPETTTRAFEHLRGLEQLHATVASSIKSPLAAGEQSEKQLKAYQVGDNDIVAAYDPAGAIAFLCQYCGYPKDAFDEADVSLVNDAMLDNRTAYDTDENMFVTLEKTLREQMAELTEPGYLHGWE